MKFFCFKMAEKSGGCHMGMLSYIREEIRVVKERDPAIKSSMEVLLYPSFKVILRYRVAHKLYLKKHYFLARWVEVVGRLVQYQQIGFSDKSIGKCHTLQLPTGQVFYVLTEITYLELG